MKKWLKELELVDYLNILAVSLVTFFVCFLLRNDYLSGDVLWEGVFNDQVHAVFPVHGRFICGPLTNIIGFANVLFDIHPMTFINTYGAFLRGIFYAGICYFMADSINIFEKKKHLTTPLVIIICFLITLFGEFIEYITFTQFFGYSICLLFYFFACSVLIKHFVLQTRPDNKTSTLWINSLFAVFMGQASYFGNVSFLAILCFVGVYFLVKFGRETSWNVSEIVSKFKCGGKEVYVPILVFILSMGYTFLNVFIGLKYQNYSGVVSSSEFVQNSLAFFGTFVNAYVVFLSRFVVYFVVIAALLISSFFLTKDKKIFGRFCFIDLIIIFSLLLFFFNLWIFGATYYNEGCWLRHNGLTLQLHSTLLYLCVCTFGFFVHNLPFSEKQKNSVYLTIFILFMVLICSCKFFKEIMFNGFLKRAKMAKEYRICFYILEKIDLTYCVKMKKPYLPEGCLMFFPREYVGDNEVDNNKIFLVTEEFDEILKIKNKYESLHLLSGFYFEEIYGIKDMKKVFFIPDDLAYEKFEEMGGSFTDEELEKCDFMYLKRYAKQLKEESKKLHDN